MSGQCTNELPDFVPDRAILNWVSVVAGYDDQNQPQLCARLVLMHDASIYAVHYCFCGFGEVVPFNVLDPVISEQGCCYERSGQQESVIIVPHFKSADAKLNMSSPTYAASNQEPSVYKQLEPFDTFNDYFISRSFLSQDADRSTDNVRTVQALGYVHDKGESITNHCVKSRQRYVIQFPGGKVLELPTNICSIAGLGTRIATTNYGEVRVGEILFRTGNPEKLIFSRRNETPEYFAIKVVNLIFIRQLESMRFKFPESPGQELRAMSYVNTLRSMNPTATEFNHLIKLFTAVSDDSCLFILTQHCSGGSLQAVVAARYPQGVPESTAKSWFIQIVAGLAVLHALHICHLDISLHNVLIHNLGAKDETVMICDFGMCLRVAVDPRTGVPKPIPFRGLCGKGLYMPPEYMRLQHTAPRSTAEHSPRFSNGASSSSSVKSDIGHEGGQNTRVQIPGPTNHQTSLRESLNLQLPPTIRIEEISSLPIEVDGFAADVWMLGVTLLFLLTGIKIQDITLINLFLNKAGGSSQPHKWIGTIPVLVPVSVPVPVPLPVERVEGHCSSHGVSEREGESYTVNRVPFSRPACTAPSFSTSSSSSSSSSSSFSYSAASLSSSTASSSSSSFSMPSSHTRPCDQQQQQQPLRVAFPIAFDLLSRMLNVDPTQRITLSDIRNHPWLHQDTS